MYFLVATLSTKYKLRTVITSIALGETQVLCITEKSIALKSLLSLCALYFFLAWSLTERSVNISSRVKFYLSV